VSNSFYPKRLNKRSNRLLGKNGNAHKVNPIAERETMESLTAKPFRGSGRLLGLAVAITVLLFFPVIFIINILYFTVCIKQKKDSGRVIHEIWDW